MGTGIKGTEVKVVIQVEEIRGGGDYVGCKEKRKGRAEERSRLIQKRGGGRIDGGKR